MSRHHTPEHPVEPWYGQGWPWFLIMFPAIAVVAGIATLVIAARTFDGMVVDDYYKEGQAIVQTIGRVERARELGLRAALEVRSDALELALSATDAANLPERLLVTVAHPTRGGLDQVVIAERANGAYSARLAPLSTGRWLFVIEDESRSWRMDGAAYLPGEMRITIDPNA